MSRGSPSLLARKSAVRAPTKILSATQFAELTDLPDEELWLGNIENPRTKRAYKSDVNEFLQFAGISLAQIRGVARGHVIAWRVHLKAKKKSPATQRRKLSALSSLFDYLCNQNAVHGNPVDGVERPPAECNEGKTPALGDRQVRKLMEAPSAKTLKGIRDRAILATLLYHGLRRAELCLLKVGDIQSRQGVMHFKVQGKGGKIRYVPIHPAAIRLIGVYMDKLGHRAAVDTPLFRPVKSSRTLVDAEGIALPDRLLRPLDPSSVYTNIVMKYAFETGIKADVTELCVHSLRATAATNALEHDSDIAKVQEWLGHANVSTTRLYDRRKSKPEESPTFRVKY